MGDTYSDLIDQYEAWQRAQGLTLGSADEHLTDENLTEGQRVWLAAFCERWQRVEQYEAMVEPTVAQQREEVRQRHKERLGTFEHLQSHEALMIAREALIHCWNEKVDVQNDEFAAARFYSALGSIEHMIIQRGVESADAYPDGYLTSYMDTVIHG